MFKLHSFLAPAIAVTVVACGARFSAQGNGGAAGETTDEGSGGSTNSAGGTSLAGEPEAGGNSSASAGTNASAGTGGASTAGAGSAAGGSTAGRGGWGSGGWGNGGRWSGNGGAASADCATLAQDYQAAVEKARVCNKGSTTQCSPSSVAEPVSGCGCPVLINSEGQASSAATKAYQAYQSAGCARGGAVCDIVCAPPTSASCEQTTSGTFECTAGAVL